VTRSSATAETTRERCLLKSRCVYVCVRVRVCDHWRVVNSQIAACPACHTLTRCQTVRDLDYPPKAHDSVPQLLRNCSTLNDIAFSSSLSPLQNSGPCNKLSFYCLGHFKYVYDDDDDDDSDAERFRYCDANMSADGHNHPMTCTRGTRVTPNVGERGIWSCPTYMTGCHLLFGFWVLCPQTCPPQVPCGSARFVRGVIPDH